VKAKNQLHARPKGQPPKLSESDIDNIIDWISASKQHRRMPFYKVVKELDLPVGTSALARLYTL
jgi:hypothetical protein